MSNRTKKLEQLALTRSAFALLAECCRQCFAGDNPSRTIELANGIDWDLLLLLARRHRVQGLVAKALRRVSKIVPPAITAALSGDASRIAAEGLVIANEALRLSVAFTSADIPILFLKGPSVGRLAYGNPFLKMAWDIDILVAAEDVHKAATVLKQLGYDSITPSTRDVGAVVRWHLLNKESVWRHSNGETHVELHSRLADNPHLIPFLNVGSPQQLVDVTPGISLPTFATAELFAYLTVHGSSSNWFRLKWITDVAGLLYAFDEAELIRFARRSQELGAGRAPAQALLLCAALFGFPFNNAASSLGLARSWVNRWLASSAMAELSGIHSLQEPTSRRFGTLRMHITHLTIGTAWTYGPSELYRKVHAQLYQRASVSRGQ